MNIFSDQSSYFLLVLVGMAAVALHAFQLYGQQIITPEKSGGNRLLDSILVISLGGRYQFYRGFTLYLAISELIYVLLASSSVILELTLTAVGRQDMAGALSSGVALNPTVPIIASTALIAATQTKPFSEYEKVLRRLAHSIAGIPGNVFHLHGRLNRVLSDWTTDALEKAQAQEAQKARQAANQPASSDAKSSSVTPGVSASIRSTPNYGILDHAVGEVVGISIKIDGIAGSTMDGIAGLDKMNRQQFERSLVKVYCLFRWTLGYDGERIWTGRQTVGILDLFSSVEQAFHSLVDKIDVLVEQEHGANPAKNDARAGALNESDGPGNSPADSNKSLAPAAQWRQVFTQCSRLENEMLTLLALLLLNKPEADLEPYITLRPLRVEAMKPERDTVFSAYTVSLLAAALLATTLVSGYLGGKAVVKHQIRSAVNVDELAPAFADNELPLIRENLPWAVLRDFVTGRGVPVEKQAQFHNGTMNGAALIGETLADAAVAVSQYLTIFALSAGLALGLRRLRKLESRWPYRQTDQAPPVLTYLSIGSSAYVFATGVLLLLTFANLAISPALHFGVSVFDEATLIQVEKVLPRVLLLPLLSIVCVWFVCSLIDSLDPDTPKLDPDTSKDNPDLDSPANEKSIQIGQDTDAAEHVSSETVNRSTWETIGRPIAWLSLLVLTVTLVLPWTLSSTWSYRFRGVMHLMPPALLTLVLAGIAITTVGYLLRRQQVDKSLLKKSVIFGCLCGLFDLILNLVFDLVSSAWDIPDTFFVAALCFFAFLVSFQLVFQRFPPQTSDRSNKRADRLPYDFKSQPVSPSDLGADGNEETPVVKEKLGSKKTVEATLETERTGE